MINDKGLGWSGTIKVKIKNLDTGEVTEDVIHNQITDIALNTMINSLDGIDSNLEIKYLAFGTDDSALDPSDTTLGTEIDRVEVETGTNNATGQFTTTFIVTDADAIGTWEEMGIFCGNSATTSVDSGIMLTRVLYHLDKTSSLEIQFSRIDSITRN